MTGPAQFLPYSTNLRAGAVENGSRPVLCEGFVDRADLRAVPCAERAEKADAVLGVDGGGRPHPTQTLTIVGSMLDADLEWTRGAGQRG